jgi:hypothetical protein
VVSFEQAFGLWSEGVARLADADPAERPALDRVVDALVAELRRRLGSSFTVQELADYYFEHGTDWCFEVAVRAAPRTPAAWDMTTVAGAAFARYARVAVDFRRRENEEE